MHNRIPRAALSYSTSLNAADRERPLEIGKIFRFLLKERLTIAISAGLFLLAAVLYVLIASPTYLATAQLMLEPKKEQADVASSPDVGALVEGHIGIIKSSNFLQHVVEKLGLASDEARPESFSISGTLHSLVSFIRRDEPPSDEELRAARVNNIVSKLRSRLWVRRIGQSTIVEIAVAAEDPKAAAAIVNAIAEQYVEHNVTLKSLVARASSQWLQERVDELKKDVIAANSAVSQFRASGDPGDQYKLAELKSVAETSRKLYETYLLNWTDAKQKISYPVSDATVVSRAETPVSKSQPKNTIIIVFALVLGTGVGIVTAIVRDFLNGTVTDADQITRETATRCLGTVARANCDKPDRVERVPRVAGLGRVSDYQDQCFNQDLRELKAVVTGLCRVRKAKLIGIVGAGSQAGATTIAYNLAVLASTSGSRVLLIDASSTNPTLSKSFARDKTTGLMEILNSAHAYFDFVSKIDKRFTLLPIGAFGAVTPGERIGSERIAFSFADLKERFDLTLIDLPAIPDSADAKVIAPLLDGTIVVARYGETSLKMLGEMLDTLTDVNVEILGIVLNATPTRGS